jgi:hypothetical protein
VASRWVGGLAPGLLSMAGDSGDGRRRAAGFTPAVGGGRPERGAVADSGGEPRRSPRRVA